MALLTVGAAGAAGWLNQQVRTPFRGYAGVEQFVDVPPGSGSRAIGARLIAAGVVPDALTFRLALWLSGQARTLKAGEYRFDQPIAPIDVVRKLARGEVYAISVTFPEGLTVADMAGIFQSRGLGPARTFVVAAQDASRIAAFDPLATNLEGYLFPETYALSRHADAHQLVELMVSRFEQTLTPDLRRAAAARGLSVHALVTLASIVEKETGKADERPLVAAVYENRLRLKMPLQCDPTVIYALQRAGRYDGNLRRADLAVDSPYNTYRYPGLPPGPIAAPGRASLESVAHPADASYLYFVSRNDGTHVFAKTLDEHNRNVQKYQVDYFRTRRTDQRSPHLSFSRSTSK
jgi:UPF0755 protein